MAYAAYTMPFAAMFQRQRRCRRRDAAADWRCDADLRHYAPRVTPRVAVFADATPR
jgi:hypothetical protein